VETVARKTECVQLRLATARGHGGLLFEKQAVQRFAFVRTRDKGLIVNTSRSLPPHQQRPAGYSRGANRIQQDASKKKEDSRFHDDGAWWQNTSADYFLNVTVKKDYASV
jgi:hypothetical protein